MICFCFIASCIYIFNDIRDVQNDKKHPTKKNRPIASGKTLIRNAIILFVLLFLFTIIINLINHFSIKSIILLYGYFIINLGYSFGLKNVPLLDIIILVLGFLIRVLYGAYLIDINVSNWLYLTVMTISFYLGLGKRRLV